MSTLRVLISDGISQVALEKFQSSGKYSVNFRKTTSVEELMGLVAEADVLAIRSASRVTPEILAAGKNLKLVVRLGAGVDNIDVPAATARGVGVMNTAAANSLSAAEHTIALMFALARKIPQATASLSKNEWKREQFVGFELTGKTLGVVGSGQIGRIVMEKALALGMNVIAFDPFVSDLSKFPSLARAKLVTSLEDLVATSDLVTLHIPRTKETKGIISRDLLKKFKKGSYILNVARGGLLDNEALFEALESGQLAGAALDVFEVEPPAFPDKLIDHPKVIATPHLGASTLEAQERVGLVAFDQVSGFFERGEKTGFVNP
ncbi:MAG: hydroxyacid dehydrogenase [Bdellovibrionota bacterium]